MWALLISALGDDGRRGEAIEAFERYASVVAELGLEPSTAVEAALQSAIKP
jgi:DNA-binding SARP family transcriptional activator